MFLFFDFGIKTHLLRWLTNGLFSFNKNDSPINH